MKVNELRSRLGHLYCIAAVGIHPPDPRGLLLLTHENDVFSVGTQRWHNGRAAVIQEPLRTSALGARLPDLIFFALFAGKDYAFIGCLCDAGQAMHRSAVVGDLGHLPRAGRIAP